MGPADSIKFWGLVGWCFMHCVFPLPCPYLLDELDHRWRKAAVGGWGCVMDLRKKRGEKRGETTIALGVMSEPLAPTSCPMWLGGIWKL